MASLDNTSVGLIKAMSRFAREVQPEDLTSITPDPTTKTIYTHTHRDLNTKGGSPRSREINALDMLLDLQSHINRGEYEDALPFYFTLRRLLNR